MVFTGTASDGTKGENCLDWTSASSGESATIGDGTAAASPDWTNSAASACDAQLPIYCVQQPDQLPR